MFVDLDFVNTEIVTNFTMTACSFVNKKFLKMIRHMTKIFDFKGNDDLQISQNHNLQKNMVISQCVFTFSAINLTSL